MGPGPHVDRGRCERESERVGCGVAQLCAGLALLSWTARGKKGGRDGATGPWGGQEGVVGAAVSCARIARGRAMGRGKGLGQQGRSGLRERKGRKLIQFFCFDFSGLSLNFAKCNTIFLKSKQFMQKFKKFKFGLLHDPSLYFTSLVNFGYCKINIFLISTCLDQ